jgi:hypothetical protein
MAKFIGQVLPLTIHVNPLIYDKTNAITKTMPISPALYGDITCIQELKLPEYYDTKPTDDEISAAAKVNELVRWIRLEIVAPIKTYEASFKVKAEKAKEKAIKGKVPPVILDALLNITEDWKQIIYKKKLESLKTLRTRAMEVVTLNRGKIEKEYDKHDRGYLAHCCKMHVIQNNTSTKGGIYRPGENVLIFTPELDSTLEHDAMFTAEQTSQSFLFKMCDKIGGMKQITDDVKVEKVVDWGTPFESAILVEAPGKFRFLMVNSIVHNTSVLGNPYFQFPCIFEGVVINAEDEIKKFTRLSETEIKNEINKLKS